LVILVILDRVKRHWRTGDGPRPGSLTGLGSLAVGCWFANNTKVPRQVAERLVRCRCSGATGDSSGDDRRRIGALLRFCGADRGHVCVLSCGVAFASVVV